jgi:putative ABC transport system ATP-binding protein
MEPIVRARGVRKVYQGGGEVAALGGVDLDISRGELLAVVGPSGSGKTTLLNCLSGLEDIDGGEVRVDGADLAGLDDNERTQYRGRHPMGLGCQAASSRITPCGQAVASS